MATSKKSDVQVETPVQEEAAPALKLHPILASGADVSPVTKGELKQILAHFADQLR